MRPRFCNLFFFSLFLLLSFQTSAAKNKKREKIRAGALNITLVGVTVPKCGSHLLKKTMELLAKCRASWMKRDFTKITPRALQQSKNAILFAHAPCTQENNNAINDGNCKTVFIYRDPRDMVVSFAFWLKKRRRQFKKLDPQELMTQLISDMSIIKSSSGWHNPIVKTFKGIDDFYERYLPWVDNPKVYTTTFEKLVGPKGGGNADLQLQELLNIIDHLELDVSQEHLQNTIDRMFGHSLTFRKGQIGSWKEHFTPEMKALFKEVAGQLLIDLGYEKDFDW